MNKLIYILLIITTCTTGWAQSTTSESLNLDQILEKVKAYNPDLKSKVLEQKIAKLTKREALGSALPQVSLNGAYNKNFSVPKFDMGGATFQIDGDYVTTYGATVNQALYTFGAIGAALRAADKGFAMVDLDLEATRNNIAYQAKVAYFQVLLAKRNLEINQKLLKNAKDNLSILQRNFGGGRPPQSDLLQLQADIENKKPLVANAEAELKATKIALNILMGEDPYKPYNIQGELRSTFPIMTADMLQVLALESPAVKAVEKSVEYQDALADVQKSAFLPQLGLTYTFNKNEQSFNDDTMPNRELKTSSLGIGIRWNLWDGGTSIAAYQKAKVGVDKSELELQKTKDQLNNQILTSLEQFKNYETNVAPLVNAVDLAQKSFNLSQKRFRSGRTSILELNNTQSLLLQAENQQALNLFQMGMTHSLIESIIGKEIE